jgi:membrane protein DedA with SNARE-associated domain
MIDWIADVVAAGGATGVFLLMVAENLFPPLPSEIIMPLAGFAAARGQLSLLEVLLAGVAGTVVGNAVWYETARWIGADRIRPFVLRYGRLLGLDEARLRATEALLYRHGARTVFLARLIGGLRTLISIPAGLVRVPRLVFYLCTTLGSLIWVGLLTLAGYWLEEHYTRAAAWLEPLTLVALAGIAAWLLWHWWQRRRARPPSAEAEPPAP